MIFFHVFKLISKLFVQLELRNFLFKLIFLPFLKLFNFLKLFYYYLVHGLFYKIPRYLFEFAICD